MPRNALNLAVARIVVCGVVLTSSELVDAARWAEWARALRAPAPGVALAPVGFGAAAQLVPLGEHGVDGEVSRFAEQLAVGLVRCSR